MYQILLSKRRLATFCGCIAVGFSLVAPSLPASTPIGGSTKSMLPTVSPVKQETQVQVVDALVRRLAPIKTLSAQFEQETWSDQQRRQRQSGEVQLKRPHLFRWLTRAPFHQDIVVHDGKVWHIDHDLRQVVIQRQQTASNNTPVQLLNGDARTLLKDYHVTQQQTPTQDTYTLRPHSQHDLFETLDLHFSKAGLTGMTLRDALGNTRQITFKKVIINAPISNRHFEVHIPKGFDVIDESRS